MSLLALGISHRSAPLALLESVALDGPARSRLASRLLAGEHVEEALVVSTCNRTELYADVSTFHGGLADLTDGLVEVTGVPREELRDQLYVHYEDRAIAHAFTVACGLDSMAVGEAQILGQLREALAEGQRRHEVGPALNTLFQQALRVGKRAHTETDIDTVSVSLVAAGLSHAARLLGRFDAARVLVVGAGGMSSLAATTASRMGAGRLTVVNRTHAKAVRLAERVGAHAVPLGDLGAALAGADIVVTSTGASGQVVDLALASAASATRHGDPQVYVDLALPHDVDPGVACLPGVSRIDLESLRTDLADTATGPQVQQVRDLVVAEVAGYLTARSADTVAPTVAALRARAEEVVGAELARLERRTPGLSEPQRDEVSRAVHRIVDKLLHTPTVRAKELTGDGSGRRYADALRELFDLDPRDTAAVSTPPAEAVDVS